MMNAKLFCAVLVAAIAVVVVVGPSTMLVEAKKGDVWEEGLTREQKNAFLEATLSNIFKKYAREDHLPNEDEDHIPNHEDFEKAFNEAMKKLEHREVPIPRWEDVDQDGNEGVDFAEFIDAVRDSVDIAAAFQMYKAEPEGDIRCEKKLVEAFELATAIVGRKGAKCPHFTEVDKDGNGGIDLEEFEHVVKVAMRGCAGDACSCANH